MKRIAVYGSLRKGQGNHRWSIGQGTIRDLGEIRVEGFDMYSLGSYPAITKGERSVLFEIYEVNDDVAEQIDHMELGAGYKIDTIDTPEGKAAIYYMDKPKEHWRKVESGDWSEYKRVAAY